MMMLFSPNDGLLRVMNGVTSSDPSQDFKVTGLLQGKCLKKLSVL